MNVNSIRDPAVLVLVGAYFELVAGSLRPAERNEVVTAAGLACTPDRLRGLAAAVGDPFAWVRLLRCLLEIPATAGTAQSDAAYARVYAIGTDFLAEQAMSILRPEDLLLIDGVLEQAAYAVSPNTY